MENLINDAWNDALRRHALKPKMSLRGFLAFAGPFLLICACMLFAAMIETDLRHPKTTSNWVRVQPKRTPPAMIGPRDPAPGQREACDPWNYDSPPCWEIG